MQSRNGPRLTYAHVYENLDERQLYSLYMIRKFAAKEALLKRRPDDGGEIDLAILENRFRSALNRAVDPSYGGRRLPKPDAVILDEGRLTDAWFGATIKRYLADQLPEDRARLEILREKLTEAHQREGESRRRPRWSRHPLWLVAAIFVAAACGAPPVRDVIGTLYSEGIAAAKALAYSVEPETPAALYEQAWVDYRDRAYDEAARKTHQIMSAADTPLYLQANCWFLLGFIDRETGGLSPALGHFRKAYEICETVGDSSRLFRISVEISRTQTLIGDLGSAESSLELALEHYQNSPDPEVMSSYYSASICLAATRGDFQAALELSSQRLEVVEGTGKTDLVAGALSEMGFWYAARGCPTRAQESTVRAEAIIFRLQDETRHVYNQINWILIQRIQSGTFDSQALGEIQRWARIRNDSRVEFYLDLALRIDPNKEDADDCFEKK